MRSLGAALLMALGLMMWVLVLNERFTQWMMPLASGANNLSSPLQGDLLWGAPLLGAALPLVAVAYASRRGFHAVRDKVLAHGDKVKKVVGGVIFLAGLAIASGGDKWLEAQIVPLLPEAWLRATTLF